MLQVLADRSHGDPRNPPPAIASELVPASEYRRATCGDQAALERFFWNHLEERLKRAGVKTVVIGGITTNYGVESTARAAAGLGLGIVSLKTRRPALAQKRIGSRSRRYFPCGRVRKTSEVIEALLEYSQRATRPAARAEEWPSSRRLGQSGQTSQPLCGSMIGLFEIARGSMGVAIETTVVEDSVSRGIVRIPFYGTSLPGIDVESRELDDESRTAW